MMLIVLAVMIKALQFVLKGKFRVFCIFLFSTHLFLCISSSNRQYVVYCPISYTGTKMMTIVVSFQVNSLFRNHIAIGHVGGA